MVMSATHKFWVFALLSCSWSISSRASFESVMNPEGNRQVAGHDQDLEQGLDDDKKGSHLECVLLPVPHDRLAQERYTGSSFV